MITHTKYMADRPLPQMSVNFQAMIGNLLDSIARNAAEKAAMPDTRGYSASAETSRRIAAQHNIEQRKKILGIMIEFGDSKGPKIASRMGYCGTSSINRHLKAMLEMGMVRTEGTGKGKKWTPAAAWIADCRSGADLCAISAAVVWHRGGVGTGWQVDAASSSLSTAGFGV